MRIDSTADLSKDPALRRLFDRLRPLLPECCVASVIRLDLGELSRWEGELLEEEARILSPKAVPKRRLDFAGGRVAAHRALRDAGCLDAGPVLAGSAGEPLWPEEWVGAISHGAGLAVAIVAPRAEEFSLGIDIEARHGAPIEIIPLVAGPDEAQWVAGAQPGWRTRLSLLFSAKEALYKALFPLGQVRLDFLDVQLTWTGGSAEFCARLKIGGSPNHPPGTLLRIQTLVSGDWVVTMTHCPKR